MAHYHSDMTPNIKPIVSKQFIPSKGRLLVKIDVPKEIIRESGIILPIAQDAHYAGAKNYNMQRYAPTHGTVTQVSASSGCKIGDTVIFHYTTEEMCGQMGRVIEDETGKYFIIDESGVVAIVRDGVLLPTDGWIIARRAEKAKEKTDGGIIIPEAHRKESDTKFVVVNVHEGYEDCAVGDVIYTLKDCDRPIESNELFGILPNDLFKIETKDIVAIAV